MFVIINFVLFHWAAFSFLLDGRLYPNNSVVTLTDIGDILNGPSLFCLTPSTDCCSATATPNEATVTREWYLPDGRLPPVDTSFSREQVSSAVKLYRNGATSPTGVFRCDVPDANGTSQSIFVGIYPLTDGKPLKILCLQIHLTKFPLIQVLLPSLL